MQTEASITHMWCVILEYALEYKIDLERAFEDDAFNLNTWWQLVAEKMSTEELLHIVSEPPQEMNGRIVRAIRKVTEEVLRNRAQ